MTLMAAMLPLLALAGELENYWQKVFSQNGRTQLMYSSIEEENGCHLVWTITTFDTASAQETAMTTFGENEYVYMLKTLEAYNNEWTRVTTKSITTYGKNGQVLSSASSDQDDWIHITPESHDEILRDWARCLYKINHINRASVSGSLEKLFSSVDRTSYANPIIVYDDGYFFVWATITNDTENRRNSDLHFFGTTEEVVKVKYLYIFNSTWTDTRILQAAIYGKADKRLGTLTYPKGTWHQVSDTELFTALRDFAKSKYKPENAPRK